MTADNPSTWSYLDGTGAKKSGQNTVDSSGNTTNQIALRTNGAPVEENNPLPANIGNASAAGDSTITVGGTAQSLFGGTAPVNGWKVANPHPTEDLWVSDNGVTAAPNVGFRIFANGGQYSTEPGEKPLGVISIYGATTGHSFSARKW